MKKFAFVFPGQGSQSVGMLDGYANHYPMIQEICQQAGDILGYNFWELVQIGPKDKLDQTIYTQPALLATSVAIWKIWQMTKGKQPFVMAGHSLGEYSALVCADAMKFEDALTLVAKRAELMQKAVPNETGAMAAVLGLSNDLVKQACQEAEQNEIVSAANYNSPGQIVIAGHKAAVERAIEHAKKLGAKRCILLAVSVPSHCALMKPAADEFSRYLAKTPIVSPTIPVIHNTTVATYTHPDDIRDALSQQLINPVRWAETIQMMHDDGIDTIIECGSGSVLTGLNKRINPELHSVALEKPESLETIQ